MDLSFCCSSDVMRDLLERRVNVFLSVWNKLRSSLDTNGEQLLSQPCSLFLPSLMLRHILKNELGH